MDVFFWTTSRSRSLGIVISVSTLALSSSAAFSAIELAPGSLEAERLGHDADRQRALLLGDLRDDRGGAGAGAAAETGGDEHHVRVRERVRDLVAVLLGRAGADGGVAAGAEAAGDLVADADLVGRIRLQERLGVRVAGDELHAHHLGADHPVDGVAAAAAHADDADEGEVLGVGSQRHRRSPESWRLALVGVWRWLTVPGEPVTPGGAEGRVGLWSIPALRPDRSRRDSPAAPARPGTGATPRGSSGGPGGWRCPRWGPAA